MESITISLRGDYEPTHHDQSAYSVFTNSPKMHLCNAVKEETYLTIEV